MISPGDLALSYPVTDHWRQARPDLGLVIAVYAPGDLAQRAWVLFGAGPKWCWSSSLERVRA